MREPTNSMQNANVRLNNKYATMHTHKHTHTHINIHTHTHTHTHTTLLTVNIVKKYKHNIDHVIPNNFKIIPLVRFRDASINYIKKFSYPFEAQFRRYLPPALALESDVFCTSRELMSYVRFQNKQRFYPKYIKSMIFATEISALSVA